MKRIIIIVIMLAIWSNIKAQSFDDNLKSHIEFLCDNNLQGRKAGSPGEGKAAEYIFNQLEKYGVTMLTGREGNTFYIIEDGDTLKSCNIVGILEGYDQNLRNEYILVGAHMDHLGSNQYTVDGQSRTAVLAGADANASGVSALLEVADILSQNALFLRRSVIFVAFGAGEEQFAGSRYFTTGGGFTDISNVKLMINLDMLGRGNAANPFEIYSLIDRGDLNSMTDYVKENESVAAIPAIHNGELFASDHIAFTQVDIPAITFSTGISREYRTAKDTPDLILYNKLAAQTHYIAMFVKVLSEKDYLLPSINVKDNVVSSNRIYALSDCDKMPEFFHSDLKHFLESWVYKYVKYPQDAIDQGIQGTVNVSFIVNNDGSISDVVVVKGLCESIDKEAIKVVSVSPKWIPGEINRKKISCKITIPIEFKLRK